MATMFSLEMGWKLVMSDIGLDIEHVLQQAKIPADIFEQVNPKATFQQFVDLWEACEQASGRPDHALFVGTAISPEAFSPALIAAQCSENMAMATKRLQRFKPLIGPMTLNTESVASGTKYSIETLTGEAMPESFRLTECIFLVQLIRLCTRKSIRPVEVASPLAESIAPSIVEYFGVTPVMGDNTYIIFDDATLAQPFVTANKSMWHFLEPQLNTELNKVTSQQSVREKVTSLLLKLIPAGNASIEAVAERLFMSKRTLQRKLNAEGFNFQQVLNDVRQTLALHYLKDTTLPSNQIAFMLGFDDPNSFIRAFSKWQGHSPEALRKQMIEA